MKNLLMTISVITMLVLSTSGQATTPTGVYSGKFGEGKITLFIDSINNSKVKGRSLYRHNNRPLTGSMKAQGSFWNMTLNEAGKNTGDGQFSIMTSKENTNTFIGHWQVFKKNDTKAGIAEKNFNLTKTECEYNKYNGNHSASTRLLSDEELFDEPQILEYMINEIYARHGYSFKSKIWAGVFADNDWYVPCYTDVSDKLTSIEQQNIKRLKDMRKYMEENPQEWGR